MILVEEDLASEQHKKYIESRVVGRPGSRGFLNLWLCWNDIFIIGLRFEIFMWKKIFNILLQYFIRKYKKKNYEEKILAKLFFTENIFLPT